MVVKVVKVAEYLKKYIEGDQREYTCYILPPPLGGGFFNLVVSPYLYAKELLCFLSLDGAAIIEHIGSQKFNCSKTTKLVRLDETFQDRLS